MRFLLTLLALLSGLSVSDRAVAAPVTPSAMGAMVVLAEKAVQADSQQAHRPALNDQSHPRKSSGTSRASRHATPHPLPGFLPGVDRAIE